MTGEFEVIHERIETFRGKRGLVELRVATLLDQDREDPFLDTIDFIFNDEQKLKHSWPCTNKVFRIAITQINVPNNGRIRVRGKILNC